MEVSRLSQDWAPKGDVFDDLVRQIAGNEDMPILADTWDGVLEEIEHEAEALLCLPATIEDGLYSGSEEVVDLWRRLEAEALALELSATIELLRKMQIKNVRSDLP